MQMRFQKTTYATKSNLWKKKFSLVDLDPHFDFAPPVGRSTTMGLAEGFYKMFMRSTPVYVTFVITGAFFGERAVDYGVKRVWENNNKGKRYEDISVLGTRTVEE